MKLQKSKNQNNFGLAYKTSLSGEIIKVSFTKAFYLFENQKHEGIKQFFKITGSREQECFAECFEWLVDVSYRSLQSSTQEHLALQLNTMI